MKVMRKKRKNKKIKDINKKMKDTIKKVNDVSERNIEIHKKAKKKKIVRK